MPRPTASGRETAIDLALARAVVAGFLARSFGRPPAGPRAPQSAAEDRRALEAAASVLDGSRGERLGGQMRSLGAPADDPAAPASYERLFGHTLRGAVCPYETEYGRRELIQQAHELADLAGFYEAFGLRVALAHRERPDHVACELEFLGFLARKEAWALASEAGDGEMLEVTRRAEAKFLREHLGRFGRAFAAGLRAADPGGVYGRLGDLCEAFLAGECERFDVPLGPAMLELRSTRDDEVPMACGSGEELVQIGGGAPSTEALASGAPPGAES